MSLHDFIDEGFSIAYHNKEQEKDRWGEKEKLKEEFPNRPYSRYSADDYTAFHKRMIFHFGENKLVEYREIMTLSLEMYGYKQPVSTRLMRFLWLSGKVRRFFKFREKGKTRQTRGVHYVFLPKDQWGKREVWGTTIPDGEKSSGQLE